MFSRKPYFGHIHDNLIRNHEGVVSAAELSRLNNSRSTIGLFESPFGLIYIMAVIRIIYFLLSVMLLIFDVFPFKDCVQPVVWYLLLYITCKILKQHAKVTLNFVILILLSQYTHALLTS